MIKVCAIIPLLLLLEAPDFYQVYSLGFAVHKERYVSKEGFWKEDFKSNLIMDKDSVRMLNDFFMRMKCINNGSKKRPENVRLVIVKNGIDTIFYHSDTRFEINGVDYYYKKKGGFDYLRMIDPYYK